MSWWRSRRNVNYDHPPSISDRAPTEIPHAAIFGGGPRKGVDYFDPPPPGTPPPTAPQAMAAPPAEIITNLDWLDILDRPGGHPISKRRAKRELDRMAIECIDRGVPFVYHGRRFPGVNG